MKKLYVLFAWILILIFSADYSAQCTGCTVTNPTLSGNYTFASGSTVCFTSNATLGDVTFLNNSKICVAPGVTVIIQNNVTTTSGNNITFEVGGTLQFNQSPTINANLTTNIQSNGTLKAGSTGNNNFSFNGLNNTLNNSGTMQVSVLQFQNSSATNIVDNYGILTIGSNINIQGNTTFRNWQTINIGQSYNNNTTSTYINCGTINSSNGFNLGGGKVINTGNFNVPDGKLDLPDGSKIDNYGTFFSGDTVNNNGTSSIIYNEGLFISTNYQGNGWLKGPDSSSKKGYFETANQMLINSSKVGPNLDFKRTSGASTQATVFNSTPTYVTSTGTTTTQAGANVSFDCRTAGNCSAPLITNIGICPNVNGTFPPQANDDNFTIAAGSFSTSNVLANDFAVFNDAAAATTSNVTITQDSTTNSGVTLNTSGIVSVAAGTPAGSYTLVYRICNTTNPNSCDSATVTVTVPPTIDAINGSQTVNSGSTGTSVVGNDTIQNGLAGSVTLGTSGNSTISQVSTTNAGVNIDANGNIVVSAGTPSGTYTVTYQICTKATPIACDTATETVTVPNLLDAVNDTYGSVTPGTSTTSVIANDKNIAGTAAVIGTGAGQVSIRTATNAAGATGAWPAGFTLNADGTISVANGTAAGTYTLYYTICNQTAGTPCDTAAVTLTVPPTIDAINGSQTVSSGSTGTSVLANDTIQNGTAVSVTLGATGNATISQTSTTNAGVNIDTATGNIVVSPGTPAGTYTVTYQICTIARPVTCDTATETVTVPNLLDAVNDTYGSVTPGTSTTSVIANDKNIAGTAAVIGTGAGQVSISTATNAAGTAGAWPAGFTLNADGTITVAAGTAAGTYTLYYTICNQTAGSPCDTTSVTIAVQVDTDGDGVPDSTDLDDDNDGILDSLECPGTASFTNGGLEGSASVATEPTGWNRVTYDEAYNEATVSGQDTVDIITSTGPASGIGLSGVPAEGNSAIHAVYGPSISGDFAQEGIKQTISGLTVGKYYRVTFKQAVVKSLNYVDNTGKWKVFLDGNFIYSSLPTTSTLAYTDPNISWESRSFIFTATATSHTIAFLASGMTTANKVAMGLDDIKFDTSCDTDNDGIPNTLDLDSDNDGCADALEGDENVTAAQLTSNRISGTVDANGVPNLVNSGGAADVGSDQGQGIGEAYNAAIQSGCLCYKPAQTTGTTLDTNHGITALGRAGDDNSNWPMVRKGAWTVLEAKTKGFVVNRLTDAQITAIPSADLREGMMVYNITQDCLQINIDGTATGWNCFNTQTCPD